jgi:hypothetical protein
MPSPSVMQGRKATSHAAAQDHETGRAPAAAGAHAGVPVFLRASGPTPLHNSPPTSGPGSRAAPIVYGRRSVQSVAAMRTDAFYRSPVNPDNPVVVWTDGANLFFSPSEAQIGAGRIAAAPEAAFAPPAGYVAEEIHWDRVEGLTSGGGALVVIARKPGEPDLDVAITNRLEQKSHFSALGITSGASSHVSRAGAEFVRVNDSSVPLEFSGASAPGAIHRVSFPDGFYRYRAAGGDHDLYVAQGADPEARLVDRATGDIARTFASGTIAAVVAEATGVVSLELNTPGARGATTRSTITVDLRTSPPNVTTTTGHATAEAGYAAAKTRLQAAGVTLTERGLRLHVNELEAIEQALALGGRRGLDALISFRTLEGGTASDPILEVTKSIGPDNAYGMADAGAGTPTLDLFQPFETSESERAATVRHEMTHVIMGATDAVDRSRMTAQQRADLEGALRFEAGRARAKAVAGSLRAGEYGAGDRPPTAGSRSAWRSQVDGDVQLASIWVELLRRYSFIPDPEGTRELRGASLADESRYSGASETSGHPADSLGEFVASFVTCATLFRGPFVAAVLDAETGARARGGSGGTYVRGLYRQAWSRIDARYVPLGANPF